MKVYELSFDSDRIVGPGRFTARLAWLDLETHRRGGVNVGIPANMPARELWSVWAILAHHAYIGGICGESNVFDYSDLWDEDHPPGPNFGAVACQREPGHGGWHRAVQPISGSADTFPEHAQCFEWARGMTSTWKGYTSQAGCGWAPDGVLDTRLLDA